MAAAARVADDSRPSQKSADTEGRARTAPDPLTLGTEPIPPPTRVTSPWNSKAVRVSVGVIVALILVFIGLAVGGVFNDDAPPVANQPADTVVPIQDDLDEETMADIIWNDVGEGFCIDSTGDLSQGFTYDDIKGTFLEGYNDPVADYGRHDPLADGEVVFDILWQRCADLGY